MGTTGRKKLIERSLMLLGAFFCNLTARTLPRENKSTKVHDSGSMLGKRQNVEKVTKRRVPHPYFTWQKVKFLERYFFLFLLKGGFENVISFSKGLPSRVG